MGAIDVDDAWSMVFACFGARERGGGVEEDSVAVRWTTGTEVGRGGEGAGRAGRAGRAGDGTTRRARTMGAMMMMMMMCVIKKV